MMRNEALKAGEAKMPAAIPLPGFTIRCRNLL